MLALLLAPALSAQVTVAVSPSAKTLSCGATFTFASAVTGATDTSVTWSSSPTAGLVNTAGLFSAPATAGTYTVKATSNADASKSASATVTVVTAPNATITTTSPVSAGATGVVASVPSQSGASYNWTLSGGTLTAGQGTNQITYTVTASAGGTVAIGCAVANGGLTTNGSKSVFVSTSGTNAFTATGSLSAARFWALGTMLPNGKVLVAGGQSAVSPAAYLSSAEVYDPAAGTWSTTGSMGYARSGHALALLPNGKVLVAGGSNGSYLSSAELYDPSAGTWSATGSMASIRYFGTMTVLSSGKVLMAGGYGPSGNTASCELYDPATGTWSATGSLNTARRLHTAVLLANGKVLVIGGYGAAELASAEIYDPATGTWSATGSMASVRRAFTAALLSNGKVLVADGYNGTASLTASELYDPAAGTWSATGSTAAARSYDSSTMLPNGKVLVYGLAYGEVYDPSTGTFGAMVHAVTTRNEHVAVLLPNGKVLIAGGVSGTTVYAASELFDPQAAPDPALSPSAAITAPVSVTTGAAGQTVSVPATAGATYVWSISGGTITGGQGTNVLTFTPGPVGTLNLSVFVTSVQGIEAQGAASMNVVAAPSATITASASAGAGLAGIKATVPSASGMTYLWTVTGATITAGATTNQVTYTAAATPGTISLQCTVINAAGDGATGTFQQTTTSVLDISGTYTNTGSALSPIVIYQQGTSATAFSPYLGMTWTGTLSGQVFSGTITASTSSTWVGKPFSLTFSPDGSTFIGTYNGSGTGTFTRQSGVVSVWITPTFQVAKVGTTAHVSAVSAGSLNKSITYSVTGGGTVDQAGNYTAPATPCMATITATPGADASKAVTSRVEVTYDGILDISGTYTNTGSALTPIVIYQQGTSATAFSPYLGMTWTGTLSGQVFSGTITASTSSTWVGKPFSLTFSADGSTFIGTYNGSGTGTFTRQSGVVSVWITPTFQVAKVGTTAHVSAVSAGSFDKSIAYSVTGGGTVDQAGNYTAPATPSMATITATPGGDPSKAVTSRVEVTYDGILDISGTYTNTGSALSPIVIYQQGTSATAFSPYLGMTWTGTLSGQVFSGTITASTSSTWVGKPFSLTFSADGSTFIGTYNGSGTGTFTHQAGVSVWITPTFQVAQVGGTAHVSAVSAGSFDKSIAYSVTGGGTVDQAGNYTAPATPCVATITATPGADASKAVTSQVEVTSDGILDISGTYTCTGSAVSPVVIYQQGTSATAFSPYLGMTWTGTLSGQVFSGTITASTSSTWIGKPFSLTFNADGSTFSGTYNGSGTGTFTRQAGVVSVAVFPASATVPVDQTQSFMAIVAGSLDKRMTPFGVQESGGGSINASGLYTPPALAGTYHVTASSVADPTKTGTATITVPVTIHLSPLSVQLGLGANQAFTAQILGSTNQSVTWTILEGSAGGSITSSGVYTAPLTNAGVFHVQATWVSNTAVSAIATVTVSGPQDPMLSIAPGQVNMSKGGAQTFVAVVQNASNPAVTWSCTGGSIDQSGHYTAPNVYGTFTVTAALTADPTILDSATVVVPGGSASGAFTYDANGNLTSDGTRTFEWDAENRLTAVTVNSGDYITRSEFSYDEMGRRTQIREYTNNGFHGTMVLGATRNFLWDGVEIAEERPDDGSTVSRHFYTQGFVDSDGTNLYYTRDHLGSVRELTDSTQSVRARYDYDPYGRMSKVSGDRDTAFGYTGHFWHSQSSLYLTMYREYDPNLGRWLSLDPIRDGSYRMMQSQISMMYFNTSNRIFSSQQRLNGVGDNLFRKANALYLFNAEYRNLYSYVSNQPIRLADPLGLKSDDPFDRCDPKKHCDDPKPYGADACLKCCIQQEGPCLNGEGLTWSERYIGSMAGGRKQICEQKKDGCQSKWCGGPKDTDPLGEHGPD